MESTHHLFLKLLVALSLLATAGCVSRLEYPASRGAGLPDEQVGIFHLGYGAASVLTIRSNEDDSLEADYSRSFARLDKDHVYNPVRLLPGEYLIVWVGNMGQAGSGAIKVRIKAGHVYEFMMETCIFICHFSGEPNRTDVWIEDLNSGRSLSKKQSYYWD